jgi:hypothetical protein
MSPTVHLHIGEPKTGTTYLQAMLFHHQESLAGSGVLVPGRNLDHIRAGHDALGRSKTAGTHATEGAWQELAEEVMASDAQNAVISMEMLTRARPPQAARAVAAFGRDADVRVVVTTRELSRLVPARWQESVQFRKSWTLDEYAAGVVQNGRMREAGPSKHFWGLHDTPVTVDTWARAVGLERVTVITLPPSGAAPDVLWTRFGEALGLDLANYGEAEQANASLGAASAEVMRRLNLLLAESDLGDAEHARICRKFLGKTVLPDLKGNEPSITLPTTQREAARALSQQLVADLQSAGVRVVGDLADLLPPDASSVEAPAPSDAQVADAALTALAAIVEQNARLSKTARRRGRDLPFAEVE